jgi:CPA1 family monovalent cation:H+ antiporter
MLETITAVLVMLIAVVISGPVTRMLPIGVPLPLVQIALGTAIAASFDFEVVLEPEIFFLLFITPLLFLDGWRIPKQGLFRDAATILELSVGLVIFTVLGMGYFIHWLLPTMPLPVAFALAAILSPTDPVAVSAITSRSPVPKRVMHILEGESLLNDASGLVCMRFAIAAALTGAFSLSAAVASFLWLAVGGIAIGAALSWLVNQLKSRISKRFGEETGTQILVSLLIPFGAYLLAEHLGCSGILAAVAAGVTMSYAEFTGMAGGETRLQRDAVWNAVQFAANGVIFVLLGEQLPAILSEAAEALREAGQEQVWVLALYVVAITAALALLRFLWVWASLRLTLFRAGRRGEPKRVPSMRLVAAVALAGVKGAITLAGVLTFPLVMNDGSPFPARELAILLAAGVIVLSLIVSGIALPNLLKDLPLPPETADEREEQRLMAAAATAAIRAVEAAQHRLAERSGDPDLYAEAAVDIMRRYRDRLERVEKPEANMSGMRNAVERELRLIGIRAERDEIFRRARAQRSNDEVVRRLVRNLDLVEARLTR